VRLYNQRQVCNIEELFMLLDNGMKKVAYVIDKIKNQERINIILNGFQKKTQKTPESEIKQALKLKEEYYADKF